MPLTARQLNRATLARQLLLRREPLDAAEGVRRVVALQAQEPASPYVGLWNRLADFDPAALDRAFGDWSVVKASLMRITLHAVHVDDYAAFQNAMLGTLRGSRLGDARFTGAGLSIAEVDALVSELLEFVAEPRAKAEIEAFVETRLGRAEPGVWWALRTFAPLWHAPTGGPWSFGLRSAMTAARTALPRERQQTSVQALVRRYLEGFGPAAIQDVAQFALIQRPVIRAAIDPIVDELVRLEGPGGSELFDVAGGALPPEDTPAPPRLLPMWDSVLLAYHDRSRVIPPDLRRIVIRRNGDVLPTLLVDGQVAGVWRSVEGVIEARAFRALPAEAWHGLAHEARALAAFLADRDPSVYRRYARWWDALPAGEVRLLSA